MCEEETKISKMNRRERRTRGRFITERLAKLKSSPLSDNSFLKDLLESVINELINGIHDNKDLQVKYDKSKKMLDEIMSLELELYAMQEDLAQKKERVATNGYAVSEIGSNA